MHIKFIQVSSRQQILSILHLQTGCLIADWLTDRLEGDLARGLDVARLQRGEETFSQGGGLSKVFGWKGEVSAEWWEEKDVDDGGNI